MQPRWERGHPGRLWVRRARNASQAAWYAASVLNKAYSVGEQREALKLDRDVESDGRRFAGGARLQSRDVLGIDPYGARSPAVLEYL